MAMTRSAANFMHALMAVLLGNLLYFSTEKYLPGPAQHVRFRTDLGTLVDFALCLAIFGLIKVIVRAQG